MVVFIHVLGIDNSGINIEYRDVTLNEKEDTGYHNDIEEDPYGASEKTN